MFMHFKTISFKCQYPKLVCRFNKILIKSKLKFLAKMDTKKFKNIRRAKTILKKKTKLEDKLSDFKFYYKVRVINTGYYWQKVVKINGNRKKSRNKFLHLWQTIWWSYQDHSMQNKVLQQMLLRQINNLMQKNQVEPQTHTIYKY